MSNLLKNQIQYTVACISEFAQRKSLTKKQAFMYLLEYKALAFLEEFYDVEHTLSFEEAISDLTAICQQNECNRIMQNYDRSNARRFLSDMTNENQNEINLFGLLFDGVHMTFLG